MIKKKHIYSIGVKSQALRRWGRTSSVTMIGQRDVRCWDEIRNRRTRNIRNIWVVTLGLGFIRKASVRRSEKKGREVL